MLDESREEIDNLLNNKNYYVGLSGNMNFSADTDIADLVISNMTS